MRANMKEGDRVSVDYYSRGVHRAVFILQEDTGPQESRNEPSAGLRKSIVMPKHTCSHRIDHHRNLQELKVVFSKCHSVVATPRLFVR